MSNSSFLTAKPLRTPSSPARRLCHHFRNQAACGTVAWGTVAWGRWPGDGGIPTTEQPVTRWLSFSFNLLLLQRDHCAKVANFICSHYILVVSNTIYMPITQKSALSQNPATELRTLASSCLLSSPLGLSRWQPRTTVFTPPAAPPELIVSADGGDGGYLSPPFPAPSWPCARHVFPSTPLYHYHPSPRHLQNPSHGPSRKDLKQQEEIFICFFIMQIRSCLSFSEKKKKNSNSTAQLGEHPEVSPGPGCDVTGLHPRPPRTLDAGAPTLPTSWPRCWTSPSGLAVLTRLPPPPLPSPPRV